MTARRLILAYALVLLAGLIAATQWVGYRLNYPPALGGLRMGMHVIYPPWALFVWARRFGNDIPDTLNIGYAVIGGSFVLATFMLVVARRFRTIPVRELGRDR